MFKPKELFNIKSNSKYHEVIFFGIKIKILTSRVKQLRRENKQFYRGIKSVSAIPKAKGLLRDLQIVDLYVLTELDKIFTNDNLTYWLDFGTLLGAVRHKGFIPWDDDIDIGMPRIDYEKFINKYIKNPNLLHKDLTCTYCNNGLNKCFVKIKLNGVHGIDVDIFPYDNYYKHASPSEAVKAKRIISGIIDNKFHSKIDDPEMLRENFKKITFSKILKEHNETVEKPSLFYGIDYPHKWENWFFDYDTIYPVGKIEFEGLKFSCPNNCDKVLSSIFGNYMELPKDTFPRHCGSDKYSDNELKRIKNIKKHTAVY